MGFEGKVAIITGAGGGLGREHALLLASLGARVVVNDLGGSVHGIGTSDAADQVVEEIKSAGGEAVANKDSVADKEGAKQIVQTAVDAFGTVDILINNAGILRDKSFKNMDLDDWDAVINVHLNGTAYVTRHAWPIMYEKNYGRIVFTSSGAGIFGNFGRANYAAAKMGMVGLMNTLAMEGAAHNVRVNALSPGASTRMGATIPGRDDDPAAPDPANHPRLVSPAVALLVSDDAPTGRIVAAAGGRFGSDLIFHNKPVNLGLDANYDDVVAHADEILATDNAVLKAGFWRED